MMRLYILPVLAGALLLMAACSTPLVSGRGDEVLKDISYGPDSLNKLDLYLPASRNDSTPLIVFIHGGAWVHGDKSGFSPYAEELFRNKWAVANINYRLVNPQVNYKMILSDVQEVIRFLSEKANTYHINTKKLTLIGHSAGGHIALLFAHHADSTGRIGLVVSYAGPTNINNAKLKWCADSVWDMSFLYPQLLGEPFLFDSKAAIDCSPVYHVRNVPTILVHGTNDPIVPYAQSLQLNDSLASKQVKHLLISVPHGDHSLRNALSDSIARTLKRWIP